MKNLIYLFLGVTLLSFNLSNAQEEKKVESFEVTDDSPFLINQFVVIEKESMSVAESFKMVSDWINIIYNTPKEVIKSKIDNEYIRIEGYKSNSPCIKVLGMPTCYDSKYSITFAFKENKIKFQVTRLQLYNAPSKYSAGGWSEASPTMSTMYKSNGKPNNMQVSIADGFTSNLNDLKNNLTEYINKPINEQTSKSEW